MSYFTQIDTTYFPILLLIINLIRPGDMSYFTQIDTTYFPILEGKLRCARGRGSALKQPSVQRCLCRCVGSPGGHQEPERWPATRWMRSGRRCRRCVLRKRRRATERSSLSRSCCCREHSTNRSAVGPHTRGVDLQNVLRQSFLRSSYDNAKVTTDLLTAGV